MLVDQEGKVRGAYSYNSSAELATLARRIRELAGPTKKAE